MLMDTSQEEHLHYYGDSKSVKIFWKRKDSLQDLLN